MLTIPPKGQYVAPGFAYRRSPHKSCIYSTDGENNIIDLLFLRNYCVPESKFHGVSCCFSDGDVLTAIFLSLQVTAALLHSFPAISLSQVVIIFEINHVSCWSNPT